MYFDYVLDKAIVLCFLLFQLTTPLAMKKNLDVDLLVLKSPTQSTLE